MTQHVEELQEEVEECTHRVGQVKEAMDRLDKFEENSIGSLARSSVHSTATWDTF